MWNFESRYIVLMDTVFLLRSRLGKEAQEKEGK